MPQLSPQATRLLIGRVFEFSGYTDSSSVASLTFSEGAFKEEQEHGEAHVETSPGTRAQVAVSILVVDDDDDFRGALIDSLLELTGAEINVKDVSTGEETLKLLEGGDTNFDWILLDLILTGITGLETFTRIREVNKVVGIILMTSEPNSSIARSAQAKGHQIFNKLDLDLNTLLFPKTGEPSS